MTKHYLNLIDRDKQRAYWVEQVEKWKLSKLKQKAYCISAGISYSSFIYWKSTLSTGSPVKSTKSFIPVQVESNEVMTSTF